MRKGQRLLEREAIIRNDIMLMRIADTQARSYFRQEKGFFWNWRVSQGDFWDKSLEFLKHLEKNDAKGENGD